MRLVSSSLKYAVLFCLPLSWVAQAASLTIVNPSFELLPVTSPSGLSLPDGTRLTGRVSTCGSVNPPGFPCEGFGPGWTTTDVDSDSNGTLNPTANMFNSALPDGEYVGYSNGTPFYQILSDTLMANTIYTLGAFIGQRNIVADNLGDNYSENQGYYMELAVDNDGTYNNRTVLARSSFLKLCCPGIPPSFNAPDAVAPGYGNFIPLSFAYMAGLGAPLGKNLMISFGAPGVQANFDMVTLTADATTPEPGTLSFLIAGLGLVFLKRSRN